MTIEFNKLSNNSNTIVSKNVPQFQGLNSVMKDKYTIHSIMKIYIYTYTHTYTHTHTHIYIYTYIYVYRNKLKGQHVLLGGRGEFKWSYPRGKNIQKGQLYFISVHVINLYLSLRRTCDQDQA